MDTHTPCTCVYTNAHGDKSSHMHVLNTLHARIMYCLAGYCAHKSRQINVSLICLNHRVCVISRINSLLDLHIKVKITL